MNVAALNLRRHYDYMSEAIDSRIAKCLEHQRWILGPEVKELEGKVGEWLGVKECVGVASGTDALLVGLRSIALKTKGEEFFDEVDEILTTPFTFSATAEAILRAGAKCVFVDIEAGSFNLDTEKVRDYLREHGEKVAGIVAVHLYGQSCNMDELNEIADEYGIFVLEDVAQAFGGKWSGGKLGTFGTAGAISFFPSKNLGGWGDGGMVVSQDSELAEFVRVLRQHGGKDKYNVSYTGYNSRLDSIQAAVLLGKLGYVEELNAKRRKIAVYYDEKLRELEGLVCPEVHEKAEHVYHQYTVRVKDGKRDAVNERLKAAGIGTAVYYAVPLHKMRLFEKGRVVKGDKLEVSERASGEVLSLPVDPLLNMEEQEYVCLQVKEAMKGS